MSKIQNKKINREIANKYTELQHMLKIFEKEGFTNSMKNIIILKRFNDDIDKAIDYLRANDN